MPNLRHECLPSNRATKTMIGLKTDDMWVKLCNKNEKSSKFALFFIFIYFYLLLSYLFSWTEVRLAENISKSLYLAPLPSLPLAEVKSHDFLKNLWWWQDSPPSGFQALHCWLQVVILITLIMQPWRWNAVKITSFCNLSHFLK